MNREIDSLISRLVNFEYYGWFTEKESKQLSHYIISLQNEIHKNNLKRRRIEDLCNNVLKNNKNEICEEILEIISEGEDIND